MKVKIHIFCSKALKPILGLLCLISMSISYLSAQSILTESFNYPPGALLTLSNWRQFGALGTVNPIAVSAGNLSYPAGLMPNMGNKVNLANNGQDVYQTFPVVTVNASTSLYSSLVVNVSSAMPVGDFFYSIAIATLPATTQGLKLYIKSNATGFSFGVQRGTGGSPVYETKQRPFNTNIMLVVKYEFVLGATNDIVKLYINPDLAHEPSESHIEYNANIGLDLASFNSLALVQGDPLNAGTVAVDAISIGTTWRSVTGPIYDYGDAPISYDMSKDEVYTPAGHKFLAGLRLGNNMPDLELKPFSVEAGADNNGINGDGLEEDAINPANNPLRRGVSYSLDISVNNPSAGARYVYAWIDFNNDGKFQAEELADAVLSTNTIGATNLKLNWSAIKTAIIAADLTKLYMRIRLTDRALIDFTTAATGGALVDERSIGNGATSLTNALENPAAVHGEVEDYQLSILDTFDYGDLPESFEKDKDLNYSPAVHAHLPGFSMGELIDLENKPASVLAPSENNSAGDNALGEQDEDALIVLESVSPGVEYSLSIPIKVPTSMVGTKYLYGWLDLNGDGRFQASEIALASSTQTGDLLLKLTWTAAQTLTINKEVEKIYLRLRLSNLPLLDFTLGTAGGAILDERSIGNGATNGNNAGNAPTVTFGEVEDYQLPVGLYDFGDVPISYEANAVGLSAPARQIAHPLVTIGAIVDEELTAHSVPSNADNNGINGDGLDEDGLTVLPKIIRGASFEFSVPVQVDQVANIIAWVDFNNDGKFDANEVAYSNGVDAKNGYQVLPIGSSMQKFWFRGEQTRMIPSGVKQLYARIRLTKTVGADNVQTLALDERAIGDGLSTGAYNVASIGEVEDYRLEVSPALFDFGDLPDSYEMNKDGNSKPLHYKPARNLPTENLYLGDAYTLEEGPHAVLPGADNNAENGDGITDDGLEGSQLFLQAGAANSFTVKVHNSTDKAANLYAWMDFNRNGRFEATEMATVIVPIGAESVVLTFSQVQLNMLDNNASKVYMRLRLIKPDFNVQIADYLLANNNGAVVDERAIADGQISGDYAEISYGEVEDYQLTVIRDYGDVPESYENGFPASHTNKIIPELTLGDSIDYESINNAVALGADNNGENGDGLDEDAILTQQTITDGVAFKVTLPINSTLAGPKHLYGWIDFNGDGIFSGDEGAYVSPQVGAISTTEAVLAWTAKNLSQKVLTAGKTYARFRISAAPLVNSNASNSTLIDTRSFGTSNAVGEVEDYQFLVNHERFDYGDAPAAYARSRDGIYSPPRQAISTSLRLGATVDAEPAAHTVADGANNNGLNGDGLDEDGVLNIMPVYKGTAYYSTVSVFNKTGYNRVLYGWIDFNNNGYFEASELASLNVPSSSTQQHVTLKWTALQAATIPEGVTNLYMRLRISEGTLTDQTAGVGGALLDERSIADGVATGLYGLANNGEVEDYMLNVVNEYDYGDAPNSYDMSRNNILSPARQAISEALYIGNSPADYEATKQIQIGNALGDDQNGIDDEGGLSISPIHAAGNAAYSLSVKVTNNTGAARQLYGWIDFNNNGRYELAEMSFVAVPNGSNQSSVVLSWSAAAMKLQGDPSQLYMRLRMSEGALTDLTSGAGSTIVDERSLADGLNTGEYAANPILFVGEVEDHIIPVVKDYDFGDVPASFEYNNLGQLVAARHLPDAGLLLGDTIDIEPAAQSVAAGMDNNGVNGDGLDEDAVQGPLPLLIPGTEYAVKVKVTNNTTQNATLHAWIDMNGDGRFSSNEYTSLQVASNQGQETVEVKWPITTFTGLGSNTYMRLRLSSAVLKDDIQTADVDERAIGDGLTTGLYGAYPINGEVEDYMLAVDTSIAYPQSCDPSDNRLGLLSPIKALYHGSIVKTANGDFLVFGSGANPTGGQQGTPAKVQSGLNGFEFAGSPVMLTGFSHQYFLLTTTGLYTWGYGYGGNVFSVNARMNQVPLPPGVGPAQVQFMDSGNSNNDGAIAILTKSGEIWIRSNKIGLHVHGDGNSDADAWHKVMLDANTPLSAMKDIRIVGDAAIATDGYTFYTWGSKISLGRGQEVTSKGYATIMQTPAGAKLPIMQQEISASSGNSASYYIRDGAGKVFVLGGNLRGQLGLGHNGEVTNWTAIAFMNEQPDEPGVQPDVTKPIKKVIWISASNSDGLYPHFSLITAENRNYTVASNASGGYGSIGGAPSATSDYLPTAVTMNGGTKKLTGKMIYVASGGHISILIRDKSDRYGYVGHTIEGSDGCNSCTNNPAEFNFTLPPSTGPVCGNTAYDFGDLDERYNLGDQASHQIKYSQLDNPLKLGKIAADSDEEPQFTVSGKENNADGDDLDGKGNLIDEDAFVSGRLPAKTAGAAYILKVPLTNNTGKKAYLYAFIDWNNDGKFSAAEALVKEVPASATPQEIELSWEDVGEIAGCSNEMMRSFIRLRLTTDLLVDDLDTPVDERSHLKASDGEVEDYYLDWRCPEVLYCYLPGMAEGEVLESSLGITSQKKTLTESYDNWPISRHGAWLVLESKTKGFVLNRVAFTASGLPVGIPADHFVEGMMVYDSSNNCLKVYTTADNGLTYKWFDISQQSCPQ